MGAGYRRGFDDGGKPRCRRFVLAAVLCSIVVVHWLVVTFTVVGGMVGVLLVDAFRLTIDAGGVAGSNPPGLAR